MSSPSTSRSGSSSRPRSSSDISPPGSASATSRDKSSVSASSSRASRTGSAAATSAGAGAGAATAANSSRAKSGASSTRSSSSSRGSSRGNLTSAGGGSGSSSGKKGKKKGSKSSKKKKKKPIVEDPRLVRELLARVENGNISVDELRHKLDSTEYNNKYDFNQSAGELIVMAAIKGRLDLLKFLYEERKANMNVFSGKALQRAALYGAYEVVEYLTTPSPFGTIPPPADLHVASTFAEYLPLHYAAQNGSVDLVRLLIQRGAKLDATCNVSHTISHHITHTHMYI